MDIALSQLNDNSRIDSNSRNKKEKKKKSRKNVESRERNAIINATKFVSSERRSWLVVRQSISLENNVFLGEKRVSWMELRACE